MQHGDLVEVEEYVRERETLRPILQESLAFLEEQALDVPRLFSKRVIELRDTSA